MKLFSPPLLAAIFLSLTTSLAGAEALQPGLWQTKTSFHLDGIPMPGSTDENCVSAEEAKDVKTSITQALQKKGCQLTKWNLKDHKLEASLKCKNNDIDAEGSLHGQVTAKEYELSGDAQGHFKSIPTKASLKLTGKWLRKCDK